MNYKYIVTLTEDERKMLRDLIEKGGTPDIGSSTPMLKLDEIPENREWTYAKIKEAYHAAPHTICQIAKRFVTGGVKAALGQERASEPAKKDRWASRGTYYSDCLLRSAGGTGTVDIAADRG